MYGTWSGWEFGTELRYLQFSLQKKEITRKRKEEKVDTGPHIRLSVPWPASQKKPRECMEGLFSGGLCEVQASDARGSQPLAGSQILPGCIIHIDWNSGLGRPSSSVPAGSGLIHVICMKTVALTKPRLRIFCSPAQSKSHMIFV